MTSTQSDISTRAVELSQRVENLRSERALARARAESAQETYDRLLADLLSQFGVGSLEDAEKMLENLDNALAEEVSAIERALEESGD